MMTSTTKFLLSALMVCLLQVLCSGCIREQRHPIADKILPDPNKPGVAGPLSFDRNGVLIEAVLDSDLARGELLLVMRIKNSRSDVITIDLSNCDLSFDDGREALPDSNGPIGTVIIKPGENSEYKLSYHPVNAVSFYERTDYRGDMKKKYSLRMDFIKDNEGALLMDDVAQFEFSDTFYRTYLVSAREKNMHIFDFGFEAEDFVHAQEKYLDKFFSGADDAHEIFALTPALTIDRTIINFRTFSEGDTLTIDMRMLNQSSHAFDVIAHRCAVKLSGRSVNPCKVYSDSYAANVVDSMYVFKPGTRVNLRLKYCIAQKAQQWRLVADWLLIHPSNPKRNTARIMPFFYSDLLFKESPITRKEL